MPTPREIAETVNDRSKFESEPAERPGDAGAEPHEPKYPTTPPNRPAGLVPARNLKGDG